MLPRVLHRHRRLGQLLCLIIAATLLFFLLALNHSTYPPTQPSPRALPTRTRSKLPPKVAAHHANPEDSGKAEKPTVGGVRKTFGRHVWKLDGLLEVNPQGRHPIYDLVDKAKKKWNAKVTRQSKTLRDAVREYKRRYQRDPPLGFDRW
jgi:hypothetical protein